VDKFVEKLVAIIRWLKRGRKPLFSTAIPRKSQYPIGEVEQMYNNSSRMIAVLQAQTRRRFPFMPPGSSVSDRFNDEGRRETVVRLAPEDVEKIKKEMARGSSFPHFFGMKGWYLNHGANELRNSESHIVIKLT